jgi:hypothetical protein
MNVPPDAIHFGHIGLVIQPDGTVVIAQNWSPSLMSPERRIATAKALHELADAMERDDFECSQDYRYFKL